MKSKKLQFLKLALFLGFFSFLAFGARAANAATLYFSPSSGSFTVGNILSVNVSVNTQAQAINNSDAVISFPSDLLEVISVNKSGSIFSLWVEEPTFSNSAGTVSFNGGLPTPGFNGTAGKIVNIVFRVRKVGTASLVFSSGAVRANDGYGTNILQTRGQAQFNLISEATPAAPPPTVPGAPQAPSISSPTHPDSNSWYAQTDVYLNWSRPSGAYGFSFELDQTPDSVPDNTLDTTATITKTYPGLKDGVWYFHIKARAQSASAGFGPTANFKIQIDTQKPLLFDVAMVGQGDLNDVTRTPTITFEAKDETSGIDHYDVYMDSEVVQASAESLYTFSKLENGPHVIRVVAFDKAGNERKAELPIIAQGPALVGFFQQNLSVPIYILLIINLLILVLFGLLIWFLFKRKNKQTTAADEVAGIQAEIDQSLEELKQRISDKLLGLTAHTNSELFNKEEKVAKEIAVSVGNTRKRIDKKIGKLNKSVRKQKDKILE